MNNICRWHATPLGFYTVANPGERTWTLQPRYCTATDWQQHKHIRPFSCPPTGQKIEICAIFEQRSRTKISKAVWFVVAVTPNDRRYNGFDPITPTRALALAMLKLEYWPKIPKSGLPFKILHLTLPTTRETMQSRANGVSRDVCMWIEKRIYVTCMCNFNRHIAMPQLIYMYMFPWDNPVKFPVNFNR